MRVKEGINSSVANSYSVLSTPVMYLVKNENNIIKVIPVDLNQRKKEVKD